ncbi:hypothetical protein BC567DRAFT_225536, partial [Phyllosticta citribraziliensis]
MATIPRKLRRYACRSAVLGSCIAVVASPVCTLLTAALPPVVYAMSMFVIGNARSRISSLMLSRCLIVLGPLSMYCYLQLTD